MQKQFTFKKEVKGNLLNVKMVPHHKNAHKRKKCFMLNLFCFSLDKINIKFSCA